jgi:lipid-A-disaccharide synthase
MAGPAIFISAGDPSGDIATARLVSELKILKPDLECFGLGGPRLATLGQKQLADHHELAVLGFWEVVKKVWYFRQLLNRCVKEIKRHRPSCILLVDYPGFNLRLAEKIKPLGIPIVYYISPQVWAWGKQRIPQIRTLVDKMLVILPFEKEFYQGTDVNAEFVGHYLLDDIPKEFIASPLPRKNHIALLPGSRKQEIERMLEPMCDAAAIFNRKYGTTATVSGISERFDYERIMKRYKNDNISVRYDNSRQLIFESDLVLTASGTATLETGLIGRPMVIVYKTGKITFHIARKLIKIDTIGLVNLVLGRKVVPEIIQNDASPERMVSEMEHLWNNPDEMKKISLQLHELPLKLTAPENSPRAAEIIARYL